MKLRVEKILTEYLKEELPTMASMVICGHSSEERPKPYIVVDCHDPKPFGDIPTEYGLLEATVTITTADAVEDTTPNAQNTRLMSVIEKLEDFEYASDDLVFNEFLFQSEGDAKENNDIGNIVEYRAIIQIIDWTKVLAANEI